jgi:clathrin heavy chain
MELLEMGQSSAEAHQGIFTELAVQYSRHRPEKLMEHVKVYWGRMNIAKVLRACEAGRHWKEAAYLHVETQEFDAAVRVMMAHSASAFNQDKFLEVIKKVKNAELYYAAIDFYVLEEPMALEKLLTVLTTVLDHARVVHLMRKNHHEHLPLILPYLKAVQSANLSVVNEAVNEVLIEDENFEGLRDSISAHDAFDQLDLAKRLEKHELLEFRRIAALLYRRNRRFEASMELSKKDNMLKDSIDTVAESGAPDLAEALLRYFVERDDKESFAACLYTCYSLVKPDVALELAWRARITDFAMPYMVQYVRDLHAKVAEIDARTKPKEEAVEDEAGAAAAYGMLNPGVAMLTDQPAYGMGQGGYGDAYGMGQQGYQQGYAQGVPQQGGYAAGGADVYTMSGATVPGQGY